MAAFCRVFLILSSLVLVNALSDEKRLIKHLLENYKQVGIIGRPVYNTSDTLTVRFGVALIQIYDLDEKAQILTTKVWLRYQWNDVLLRWNPADFGGVDHVRVPHESIWKPDNILYNSIDEWRQDDVDALAVVSHDGTVLWIPQATLKSSCSLDITRFPYDEQSCSLKFGSWTYDGFKLDFDFYDNHEAVDANDYIPSNEWDLIAVPAVKNVKYYPCCVEPYPDLTFTLRIKRKSAFYNYTLILPSMLLSILGLVIFWIPPEASDRLAYGIGLFLAFFVLLLMLADITPPAASSIPLLGAYVALNMVMITLCTMSSVFVINMHIKGEIGRRMPKCVRVLMLDCLGRVLLVTPCGRRQPNPRRKMIDNSMLMNTDWKQNPESGHLDEKQENSLQKDIQELGQSIKEYIHFMKEEKLRECTERERKEQEMKAAKTSITEWKMLARVLDRLFFVLYLIVSICICVLIFPNY